jgi:hypothetical protein
MKKIIIFATLFCSLFSYAEESRYFKANKFDLKATNKCVNALQKITNKSDFHKPIENSSKGKRYFEGKVNGKDGVIFQDHDNNFRFVSNDDAKSPKKVSLKKNENYVVGLQDRALVVKEQNSNNPPLMTMPITSGDDFINSLSVLIDKYGASVVDNLREQDENGKKQTGIRDLAAFQVCVKVAKITENNNLRLRILSHSSKAAMHTSLNRSARSGSERKNLGSKAKRSTSDTTSKTAQ